MADMDALETVTLVRKIEYERKLQPSYIVSYTPDVTDNETMLFLSAGSNEVTVSPPPEDFISGLAHRFEVDKATAAEVLASVMGQHAIHGRKFM